MERDPIESALEEALAGRRLLEHPFYQRWEQGLLGRGELAAYAAEYRGFEEMLPGFLARVAADLPQGRARTAVEANLADELGDPVPHLELFERFAAAVDAAGSGRGPAAAALVEAYTTVAAAGPVAALAGLLAYESQAPAVALSKAEGLRRHYGLGSGATAFWDHHATVDVDHAAWTVEALTELGADPAAVTAAARIVADAWWGFLDERETAAA
jgi:pyrroloquinoline quinone (PQQ) biosynthesis protein C